MDPTSSFDQPQAESVEVHVDAIFYSSPAAYLVQHKLEDVAIEDSILGIQAGRRYNLQNRQ